MLEPVDDPARENGDETAGRNPVTETVATADHGNRPQAVVARMQMPFPRPRGEISAALCEMLAGSDLRKAGECLAATAEAICVSEDLLYDEDLQLSLFILYGLNRNWFIGVDGRTDWGLRLSGVRTVIETAFEDRLRRDVEPLDLAVVTGDDVGEALANMVRGDDAPSVADFVFRSATIDQTREFLVHE